MVPPVDRFLLTVTRGRFGSAPGHTLLPVTTGARSGLRRETPLFFVRDGQRLVLTASKGEADRREEYRVR